MSNYRTYYGLQGTAAPGTRKQYRRWLRKRRRDLQAGGPPSRLRVPGVPGHPGRRREYLAGRQVKS